MNRQAGFLGIQVPGWALLVYLVYAQAIPAFNYELGVAMGTQESATQISEVGVAFFYGFAFGDLLIYIPLLALGLIGHGLNKNWGHILFAAAAGISMYWPVVCLSAVVTVRDAPNWHLEGESGYWIVLPLIALWGAWGLRHVVLIQHGSHRI